jgi:hypothetical protein
MGGGLKRARATAKAPRPAGPLAKAAAKIRADVKTAVADGTLPPYPDGVAFRARSRHSAVVRAIDVEVLNVPRSWLFDGGPSSAWLALSKALTGIAARHFEADGVATRIDVTVDYDTQWKG